jgi:predicted PurR-regulated permease PerM
MIIDDGMVREARRRHTIFLCASAAIVVGVLVVAHSVLLPFVLALVIAYVLTPLVAWVEKRRVPRAAAIILVYVMVLGSLGIFVRFMAPRVGQELASLRRELPGLGHTVRTRWVPAVQRKLRDVGFGPVAPSPPETRGPEVRPVDPPPDTHRDHDHDHDRDRQPGDEGPSNEPAPTIVARPRADGSFGLELSGPLAVTPAKGGGYVIEPQRETREAGFDLDKIVADAAGKSLLYAQHNALEIVKIGRDIIAGVSRFFFVFGITLMLAAYMMLTRERITSFFVSLVRPDARPSFKELLARIDRGLSGVVRGQLIICLVNGVLSAIGFAIVGLKYWPVLALIATVLSLIPIFGSIFSAIPAVALGLTQSFGTAVFVLAWIIGIHQLEANFLNPKIMGDAAKIHPVLVVFSLLVGEHFFHTAGALLAVPCMSIAQSVFTHVRRRIQAMDPEMAHEHVGSLAPPPPEADG